MTAIQRTTRITERVAEHAGATTPAATIGVGLSEPGATLWSFCHESRATSPPIWAQNPIRPLAALAKLFGVRPYPDRWESRDTPRPEPAT